MPNPEQLLKFLMGPEGSGGGVSATGGALGSAVKALVPSSKEEVGLELFGAAIPPAARPGVAALRGAIKHPSVRKAADTVFKAASRGGLEEVMDAWTSTTRRAIKVGDDVVRASSPKEIHAEIVARKLGIPSQFIKQDLISGKLIDNRTGKELAETGFDVGGEYFSTANPDMSAFERFFVRLSNAMVFE